MSFLIPAYVPPDTTYLEYLLEAFSNSALPHLLVRLMDHLRSLDEISVSLSDELTEKENAMLDLTKSKIRGFELLKSIDDNNTAMIPTSQELRNVVMREEGAKEVRNYCC